MLTCLHGLIRVRNNIGLHCHEKEDQERKSGEALIVKIRLFMGCFIGSSPCATRLAKVAVGTLILQKKIDLFAYGGRKFPLKSNIMMHFWFLFADVVRLTKTVTDANHYLNAKMACLVCTSQKLQLPLRDFAMSWSAASPSVRHDLSSRFRGYSSM